MNVPAPPLRCALQAGYVKDPSHYGALGPSLRNRDDRHRGLRWALSSIAVLGYPSVVNEESGCSALLRGRVVGGTFEMFETLSFSLG